MSTPAPEDVIRITAPPQLRLSELLSGLRADTGGADAGEGPTLGEILDHTAHAGYGFMVALLALIAIPFVGMSTPFGLAIAFVGVQIAIRRVRPWLPRRLCRTRVSPRILDWLATRLVRATRWMTRLVRPRWTRLARGPGFAFVGLGLVVQGIGLALPLPVPGSNWVFIAPILVYAIGALEDDGLVIAAGHVATVINAGLMFALWRVIAAALSGALSWIGG